MKDIGSLMKQAQAMQAKLQEAQGKLAQMQVEGSAGAGLVTLTLAGTGVLTSVKVHESLLDPQEGELVGDLIVAAHADAKAKLDAAQAELMKQAAGPLAGMGLPGLKF
jgi:DNA-binding YbaB/EbfC family protein